MKKENTIADLSPMKKHVISNKYRGHHKNDFREDTYNGVYYYVTPFLDNRNPSLWNSGAVASWMDNGYGIYSAFTLNYSVDEVEKIVRSMIKQN